MMTKNEGTWDRAIRITVGLAGLSLVVIGPKSWWALFALIPLITGLVGYCPGYTVVGVSTCAAPKKG